MFLYCVLFTLQHVLSQKVGMQSLSPHSRPTNLTSSLQTLLTTHTGAPSTPWTLQRQKEKAQELEVTLGYTAQESYLRTTQPKNHNGTLVYIHLFLQNNKPWNI